MHIIENITKCITYLASFLTLSLIEGPNIEKQAPLLSDTDGLNHHKVHHEFSSDVLPEIQPEVHSQGHHKVPRGPIFKPPSAPPTGDGSDFVCDYSNMVGRWTECSEVGNRGCWLRNEDTGFEFNIATDYEQLSPTGIVRNYTLYLADDKTLNVDGLNFPEAKVFNNSYPGPWIQACWGDVVDVTVYNNLLRNGTSVHWHGIRQNQIMHIDGVNGVTQCPIAPGDKFTYTWTATQYGSSWYHSHYSVQYADGAVGPITLHGPSSDTYDIAPDQPILITDWGHNSAFDAQLPDHTLQHPSILLNRIGNLTRFDNTIANSSSPLFPYKLKFEAGRRYLLRIINTSFDTTFVFSIDHHELEFIASDFVPIKSYTTHEILVGIGQCYHVIVEANPNSPSPNGNYWINTWVADSFSSPSGSPNYWQTGVIQYNGSNDPPTTSSPRPVLTCADEPYESLVPIVEWNIPTPPDNNQSGAYGENWTVQFVPSGVNIFPLQLFSLGSATDFDPILVDYSDPTLFHLNYTGKWNPLWVVFPEDYTATSWVFFLIQGSGGSTSGAHPIHLHGHDFAILNQTSGASPPANIALNLNNPPRRDVVLLPTDGYVVIAFKTDNPGAWLVHCHIARHASGGLGAQILERREAAAEIWPDRAHFHALTQAQTICNNWNEWWGNCTNWWPGDGSACPGGGDQFSPDSGV